MPPLNSKGEWCSGYAGSGLYWGTVNPDDSIVGHVIYEPGNAGGSDWINDDEIITQRFGEGFARAIAHNVRNGNERTLYDGPTFDVTASKNNNWAIRTVINNKSVVKISSNQTLDGAGLGPMGPDGSLAYKVDYFSSGPWKVINLNGNEFKYTDDDCFQLTNYGSRKLLWIDKNYVVNSLNLPTVKLLYRTINGLQLIDYNGEWWVLYQTTEKGCILHPLGSDEGHIITTGNFFRPYSLVMGDKIRILWATEQGEGIDQIRAWTKNPLENRVRLTGQQPQPGDNEMMIKSFEHPYWMASYFSHHERYGDVPMDQHMGNAIVVIGDERDASVRNKEYFRLAQLNQPLIVDIGKDEPPHDHINLVIAWLAAGKDINELKSNVERALNYHELPVIAYLDSTDWPRSNPFNSSRIFPSIQAYRFPNETLNGWSARVQSAIDVCKSYGLQLSFVPRLDDFNGGQQIQNILDCVPFYEQWMREYQFRFFMPFADLRRNEQAGIFGFRHYPSLLAVAKAFFYACPSGKPNRNDYWRKSNDSLKNIWKNKRGQSRAALVMEEDLRNEIDRMFDGSNPNPPNPPNPNPTDPDGVNWSTDEWKSFVFNLKDRLGFGDKISFEALKAMRPEINKHGADWQNGWRGDYRERIFMPLAGLPIPMTPQEAAGNIPEETWSKLADLGDFGTDWKWIVR